MEATYSDFEDSSDEEMSWGPAAPDGMDFDTGSDRGGNGG